jgi:AhpD family alkylhydroperoxidase
VTVKTAVSRFQIHDELTAPPESAPLLKGILGRSPALANLLSVLAGAPAALRSYVRLRAELRSGPLDLQTRERIALAVAHHRGDEYSLYEHARLARTAGLGLDEITRARSFGSADERLQALLSFLDAAFESQGPTPVHLLEEAREAGWSDEEILAALIQLGLSELQSIVSNAAGLPRDDSAKGAVLPVAA